MKHLVVLGLLSVALILVPVADAQQVPDVIVSPSTGQITWDHSGLDVNGGPELIAGFDVAIASTGTDVGAGAPPLKVETVTGAPGANTAAMVTLAAAQPNGLYDVWVRTIDQAGNKSAWTGPSPFGLDSSNPAAPGNLQVSVVVTVTVTTP